MRTRACPVSVCRTAFAGIVSLALSTSCGTERPAPPSGTERSALGGDVAARVGDEVIHVALVAKVAADQRVSADEALRRLVDDAIVASAARSRGMERTTDWRLRSARARFTADKLLADAKAKGPPTDEEVQDLLAALGGA